MRWVFLGNGGFAMGMVTLFAVCLHAIMEGPPMTFVFHHGGKFKKDEGGNMYYEPDHTEVLMGVEGDTLDVFFVKGYYVELGYAEAREYWWKSPGVPLEYGLRRLATDHDLIAMVKDCRRNFNLINLQPTKPTPAPSQTKEKTKVTTTTRAGRHVKTLEVEEDSDSHDSYESAKDSLYKPPNVLRDDESSSDSDDGVNSTGQNKKSEVKEKHKPAKTRLAEKEIETDDSSYEASEDEDDSDSDLEDNPLDDGDSDLNSWHSEDSGQELESDEESPTIYPQYNDKAKFEDLKFEVSMIFKSKEHFMHATRDYTIQLGRNILFTKNDNVWVRAVCKADSCPWVVYCARSKQDGSWQIKTLVDNHICPRRQKNRAATQQWTLSKLVPKLRKHPIMRHCEVYEWFVRKCNVNLNSTCITRALKAARKVVEGDEVAQYGLIWDYANELLTSNPGSTVQVGVIPMPEGPPQFERFYVCLDTCKKGFKAGCRPMIGLDGAFLKTLHGGQILTVCAQDANNHIFVVTYAIVDVENKDNWKWFLDLLQSDLGNYNDNKLCIISDMQKGLIPAVKEVMPMAQHRFCVWHLWQNFSKQWGSTELKDLVWECVRSRTRNEFERNMKRVKVINEQAWQYLEK
ncbi:uncharacterized protein LOC130966162 [Arachis stenosperma]|uniref:uncharacterized protein LOC130966162 n=1 Tax=Arachis stenosperma TaxID=217475 RepID=UPI0025AC5CAD|nr:uncharacterized protein LOC130966162 [Arachis stenosperma]